MNKTSFLVIPMAFAFAASALAADKPRSSASVSVSTPAYYYDYKTHSSAVVSTNDFLRGSTWTSFSNGRGKRTTSTGTKTTSSTGTTTTGTTTTGTTTTVTTTTGTTTTGTTTTFPAFGSTTTIYAAVRTDSIPGSGTKLDPYDASTETKFDAILAKLLGANGAQRTTLNLAAGTYTLTPVRVAPTTANPAGYVNNIPGNLEIIGAGVDKTIIRAGIVSTASSAYWMFAYMGSAPGDYFENLTLDCNIQNQTASKITIDGIEDIQTSATPATLVASNLHLMDGGNHANDTGYSEWFGVQLANGANGTSIVTGCLVDHYQGTSGCTALGAYNKITNNTVVLNNSDPFSVSATPSPGGGFQNAFGPGGLVSGNVCQQCTFGVYSDVDSLSGIEIENNNLEALYGGVFIYIWSASASATLDHIYVHNNTIEKTYMAGVALGTGATATVNSDLFIYDNTITTDAVTGLNTNNLLSMTTTKDSEAFGNTFIVSPASKTSLPVGLLLTGDLNSIAWYDNAYNTGAAIPAPTGVVTHALSTLTIPTN